jgi:hypothetical protein
MGPRGDHWLAGNALLLLVRIRGAAACSSFLSRSLVDCCVEPAWRLLKMPTGLLRRPGRARPLERPRRLAHAQGRPTAITPSRRHAIAPSRHHAITPSCNRRRGTVGWPPPADPRRAADDPEVGRQAPRRHLHTGGPGLCPAPPRPWPRRAPPLAPPRPARWRHRRTVAPCRRRRARERPGGGACATSGGGRAPSWRCSG